jgi:hypothetical protein
MNQWLNAEHFAIKMGFVSSEAGEPTPERGGTGQALSFGSRRGRALDREMIYD